MQDVIFEIQQGNFGGIGYINLNRPKKLNAINHSMIRDITNKLLEWKDDNNIGCIIIQSANEKNFCAGGDLKDIYIQKNQENNLAKYFSDEYKLCKFIGDYQKPIISILDGYTMGGGVGLGMHVKYPFATKNFIFAMPETLIGLFPDIGGRYLLANLPGYIGNYLALTSRSIDHNQAEQIGLIDYMIENSDIHKFKQHLLEFSTVQELESYLLTCKLTSSPKNFDDLDKINIYFSNDTAEEIINGLRSDSSIWSQQVLQDLQNCSPLSLKVTLRAMQLSKEQTLEDCLFTDYRIVNRMLEYPDFFEGIRAKIIDKDNKPVWEPSKLEDISEQDVFNFFEPLEKELAWI